MKNLDQLFAEHAITEEAERKAHTALVDGIMSEAKAYGITFDYWSLICNSGHRTEIVNRIKEEYEKHWCKGCEQPKPDATNDGEGLCAECVQNAKEMEEDLKY